ncbi:MAG: phosphoribosylaminoimidazole-succinocarboxamide synthase, partial [Methanothermococcus sp.]|nr:phosphoribosylaminoimidazole-succinocarboxamide synthase [Methanothermococcus sp.]
MCKNLKRKYYLTASTIVVIAKPTGEKMDLTAADISSIIEKQPLYSGKAKSIYEIDDDKVLIEFRDDITAGNGEKHD